MPSELKNKEAFDKLMESATEVRVVRHGDEAKLKLRTKSALYTYKTTTEDADATLKATKTPVVEL